MRVAVTGGTGFLGRYILRKLVADGHAVRAWFRPASDRAGLDDIQHAIEWMEGGLGDPSSARELVRGCDAVVHAALDRPGGGFRGAEGDVATFVETNVVGTIRLIEAAKASNLKRFVFISTCAVHERILPDRPLDETHPLWPTSHYGAHKAAIEKFIHSYGFGEAFPICSLRPTGIYGVAHPASQSKWFELIRDVAAGHTVHCQRGGKEVHASDVAKAVLLLLEAPANQMTGEAFNCYDRYISEWDVAHLARRLSGSRSEIQGQQTSPKNQIATGKIRDLGMRFGGESLLEQTVQSLLPSISHRP